MKELFRKTVFSTYRGLQKTKQHNMVKILDAWVLIFETSVQIKL